MLKRLFDVIAALVALGLLSPVLAATAVVVRIGIGSPVIFRQKRPGYKGLPFTIYKFRTMKEAWDAEGKLLPDDQRLTWLGSFLRNTSIDELPELINVLKGEMSLVGPRPLLMEYLDRYTEEQHRRHAVKPGITGLAQISGRNAIQWEEKFALDVWYADNHTFSLDLAILAKTLIKAFKQEGINQPGHATAAKFNPGPKEYDNDDGQ